MHYIPNDVKTHKTKPFFNQLCQYVWLALQFCNITVQVDRHLGDALIGQPTCCTSAHNLSMPQTLYPHQMVFSVCSHFWHWFLPVPHCPVLPVSLNIGLFVTLNSAFPVLCIFPLNTLNLNFCWHPAFGSLPAIWTDMDSADTQSVHALLSSQSHTSAAYKPRLLYRAVVTQDLVWCLSLPSSSTPPAASDSLGASATCADARLNSRITPAWP